MTDNPIARTVAADRSQTLAFVAAHPGFWLPGLYMMGSTIGMLDSWWFFHQFGVNVFLYSDLSDFLLASFREPGAWLVMAWTALLGVLDHSNSLRIGRSVKKRWWLSWYGTRRYRQTSWVLAIVFITAYIAIFAGMRANNIYEERGGKTVRVSLTNSPDAPRTAILLGSTMSFLFLYDHGGRTVSIHPYENVLAVESDAPRG